MLANREGGWEFFDQLSINIPCPLPFLKRKQYVECRGKSGFTNPDLKYIHSGLNKLNYFTLKIILIISDLNVQTPHVISKRLFIAHHSRYI